MGFSIHYFINFYFDSLCTNVILKYHKNCYKTHLTYTLAVLHVPDILLNTLVRDNLFIMLQNYYTMYKGKHIF